MPRTELQTDSWRILLFGRGGDELLLFRSPRGFRLPELHIPRGQRVAPNLNAEAKRSWKLDTVCLLPLEVSHGDLAGAASKYHVMELCRTEDLARVAPDLIQMSAVKEDSFADAQDYWAVQEGMGVEGPESKHDDRGPFAEFGAFGRISAWVEEQLRPLGLGLDGNFRQLQATASFALIRFATHRGAVWFKAVGDPNLREFSISRLLSAALRQYLPGLLAAKTEWNAWLTEEAGGQGLFESSDPATWCRAAKSLAELQIASLPHTPDLLTADAHDVRSQKLLTMAAPFFLVMEEIMEAQTKTTVPKLSPQEIRAVRERVTEALGKLQEHDIPDALNHLDLNPCNVVVSTNKCTFLDWAQAAVGNPFFSLEYLRQDFLHAFPGRMDAERDFCSSYANRWKPILGDRIGEDLSRLVPIAAAFAFAASALPWDSLKMRQQPELAAFLRSLVRRMHRESQDMKASRAA
jgi:Phosphotransferase enzyme family